jgi:hypothetical protein
MLQQSRQLRRPGAPLADPLAVVVGGGAFYISVLLQNSIQGDVDIGCL